MPDIRVQEQVVEMARLEYRPEPRDEDDDDDDDAGDNDATTVGGATALIPCPRTERCCKWAQLNSRMAKTGLLMVKEPQRLHIKSICIFV